MSSLCFECESEKRTQTQHLDLEVLYIQVVLEIMAVFEIDEGVSFGFEVQKNET